MHSLPSTCRQQWPCQSRLRNGDDLPVFGCYIKSIWCLRILLVRFTCTKYEAASCGARMDTTTIFELYFEPRNKKSPPGNRKKVAETTYNRLIRCADASFIYKDAWTAAWQHCPTTMDYHSRYSVTTSSSVASTLDGGAWPFSLNRCRRTPGVWPIEEITKPR